jgi:hypothetical protein
MDLVIACGMCGGDAATDTMLVQAALAGVLSVPWFFRDKLAMLARPMRGIPEPSDEYCPLPPAEDDG